MATLLKQGTGTSTAPDESVKSVQSQLGITADGIFGPQTAAAVRAYQQSNGLTVDGIVGPQTLAALSKSATPAKTTPAPTPTAPVAKTTTSTLLKQGSGTSVAPDQNVLAVQKQLGITADGVFGQQTKSAVMKFQQENGLTVDGIVGPNTLAALKKVQEGGTTVVDKKTTATDAPFDINQATYVVKEGDKNNPYNGQPLAAGTKPGTVLNNPQSEIDGINSDANASQDLDLSALLESGDSVDTSNSDKLIKSILKTFESGGPAKAKPLTEQLADKRAELGVDPLEKDLNAADAELRKLDADFLALNEKESGRVVPLGQIGNRQSQERTNYNKDRAALELKRNAIADSLNTKYSVINTYMQYAGQDYQNAQQEYDRKFNQSISMINLFKNIEESEKSDQEKVVDNAKANLKLLTDAVGDKDFSELDANTAATINKLELQAKLPKGFTKFLMDNATPETPVTSIGGEFTNASGLRQVPIYSKDPSTGLVTAKVITIGTGSTSGDGEGSTKTNKANAIATIVKDFQNKIRTNGWAGANPDDYDDYVAQLTDLYGASAALELDKSMADLGITVDYENK